LNNIAKFAARIPQELGAFLMRSAMVVAKKIIITPAGQAFVNANRALIQMAA
jgi:hypothetical protein